VLERAQLTDAQLGAMEALLDEHFEGVSRATFRADLARKERVVWLEDERGALQGFTTFALAETDFEGERVRALYSGDTIVRPSARCSSALARAWIGAVEEARRARPEQRLYWLLIVSGLRTYRFLPVYWRAFWPRCDAPTPAAARRLLARLAGERYGSRFDEGAGLVRLEHPQRLRERSVSPERARDPHVAFFLQRNPGWRAGDELVCLAELSPANLTRAGARVLRTSLAEQGA
jgi:hypothetical protein